jgi:hypothetical protein
MKKYLTKKKEQFDKIKVYLFIFVLSLTFFILLNFSIVMIGDEIKNVNYGFSLTSHVKSNNLSLPMPFFAGDRLTFYENNFNKSIYDFQEVVINHYIYNDKFDCKYWSYVWTLWFKENEDKYDLNLKYIDTKNHLFVMIYNDKGYCTLDLFNANCLGDVFKK